MLVHTSPYVGFDSLRFRVYQALEHVLDAASPNVVAIISIVDFCIMGISSKGLWPWINRKKKKTFRKCLKLGSLKDETFLRRERGCDPSKNWYVMLHFSVFFTRQKFQELLTHLGLLKIRGVILTSLFLMYTPQLCIYHVVTYALMM